MALACSSGFERLCLIFRYVSGEDREEQEKTHIAMSEDEIAKMHEKIKMPDGTKRAVEKLISRRKAKGGGYECVAYSATFTSIVAHLVARPHSANHFHGVAYSALTSSERCRMPFDPASAFFKRVHSLHHRRPVYRAAAGLFGIRHVERVRQLDDTSAL